MKVDLNDIDKLGNEADISYSEFAELHEIWKQTTRAYFSQIKRKGDLLNFREVLSQHFDESF